VPELSNMMWFILTSGSDTGPDAKCDRLDKLYKVLIAPTTFYILISWHVQTYMWNLYLNHPQLVPPSLGEVTESDLRLPMEFTNWVAGALGLSIIFFVLFVFIKGRIGLLGRFATFYFLLISLTLATGLFIQAIFPFVLIPLPVTLATELVLRLIFFIILPGVISIYVVWRA